MPKKRGAFPALGPEKPAPSWAWPRLPGQAAPRAHHPSFQEWNGPLFLLRPSPHWPDPKHKGGAPGGKQLLQLSPSSHLARPRPSPPSRVSSVRLHRRPAVVLFPAQGPGPWPPTRKWPGVTPTPRCHDNAPPPAGLGPGKASALGRTPPPGSVEGVPKQGRHFAFQGGYGGRQGQSQLPLSLSLSCHLQAKSEERLRLLARKAARILLGYGLHFPEFLSLPCWMRISGS